MKTEIKYDMKTEIKYEMNEIINENTTLNLKIDELYNELSKNTDYSIRFMNDYEKRFNTDKYKKIENYTREIVYDRLDPSVLHQKCLYYCIYNDIFNLNKICPYQLLCYICQYDLDIILNLLFKKHWCILYFTVTIYIYDAIKCFKVLIQYQDISIIIMDLNIFRPTKLSTYFLNYIKNTALEKYCKDQNLAFMRNSNYFLTNSTPLDDSISNLYEIILGIICIIIIIIVNTP